MSFGDPEKNSAPRWFPRWVAAGIWGAFILLCLGKAVNHGLSCADDGWYALVAKSLTQGHGYATPFTDRGECLEPVLFNPWTGTGPTLILPCAALLKIVGIRDVVPGIAAICVWGSVFSLLLALIARAVTDWSLPLGVGLFCLAIVALFNSSQIWSTGLGEIPAVAFLAMGHGLAALGKPGRRNLFFSGLFLGLAVQTKLLAALACIGAFWIVAVRIYAARSELKKCFQLAAFFLLGCGLPTFLFEAWKLTVLGCHGWLVNWQEFFGALHEMTVQKPPQMTLELIQQRIALLEQYHSIHLIFLLALVAVAAYLLPLRPFKSWSSLFAGLVLSIFISAGYWLISSVGWIRYLTIAAGLGCFALSVPIYGLPQMWKKLLYAVLLLIFLGSGLALFWPRVTHVENGLFHPSSERLTRNKLVAAIQDLKQRGPLTLVSRYWAEFADVEYLLAGSMNFQQLGFNRTDGAPAPRVVGLPGKKVVLINRHWGAAFRAEHPVDERADIEMLLDEKITAVLFSEGPFELLETGGPAIPATNAPVTVAQTDLGKQLHAYISAAPNPVPPGPGAGTTWLDWNTGDGSLGEVYLSGNGGPEILFTRSNQSVRDIPWISAGSTYEFRLYQAPDRKNLLATVKVTRLAQ